MDPDPQVDVSEQLVAQAREQTQTLRRIYNIAWGWTVAAVVIGAVLLILLVGRR